MSDVEDSKTESYCTCDSKDEIWKDVVGYEGLYLVSSCGRVKSVKTDKIFNTDNYKISYPQVRLSKEGKAKTLTIHKLVLKAFIGPRPPKMECCHFDDNKRNNHLTNLRWGTKRDNALDRQRNGRDSTGMSRPDVRGQQCHMSKLTDEKVLAIRELEESGKFSQSALARIFGLTTPNIRYILKRLTWKHI